MAASACTAPLRRTAFLLLATVLLCAFGCIGGRSGGRASFSRLAVAGAQIPVELVESWTRSTRSAQFELRRIDPIYLSQHGFDSLASGEALVAITDRPPSRNEIESFGDRQLEGVRIGFYGYALYVSRTNPLDSVYAGHLRYLFQRKLTDWKELGGPAVGLEGPIRLIGPEKGTRGGEILLRQAQIWFDQPTWETRPTDAQVVEDVAADPMAIGFAAIGLDQQVRYLGLRMERNSAPAFPSLEEIESERYGLAKVIYVFYVAPASPEVSALLDYLFSDEGAAALRSTNVWPLPRRRATVMLGS